MIQQDLVDRAGTIREGEELDLNGLKQYLEPTLGKQVAALDVKQFPGGHSNLTYLLSSGKETWVLRRPPFGSKVKSAHDMSREYRILSALEQVYPYGPVPLLFCEDHDVIGSEFYLMSYIEGLVIRREYPAHLAPGRATRVGGTSAAGLYRVPDVPDRTAGRLRRQRSRADACTKRGRRRWRHFR